MPWWKDERPREKRKRREAPWGEKHHEHMAKRNNRCLPYTTGKVAKPTAKKVN